jgi:hypothetical protein
VKTDDALPAATDCPASAWAWFGRQPEAARTEARRRFDALVAIDRLAREGAGRTAATTQVAAEIGVTAATVWNWARAVKDVPVADWLPHLAPRKRGGPRRIETA